MGGRPSDNPVNIEPASLNIPLVRRKRWALRLIVACGLAVAAAAFADPAFAKVLAASCIAGLPGLWLFFFPPHAVAAYTGRGGFMRVLTYAVLFAYLAIAKGVLMPAVLAVLARVLG